MQIFSSLNQKMGYKSTAHGTKIRIKSTAQIVIDEALVS